MPTRLPEVGTDYSCSLAHETLEALICLFSCCLSVFTGDTPSHTFTHAIVLGLEFLPFRLQLFDFFPLN